MLLTPYDAAFAAALDPTPSAIALLAKPAPVTPIEAKRVSTLVCST